MRNMSAGNFQGLSYSGHEESSESVIGLSIISEIEEENSGDHSDEAPLEIEEIIEHSGGALSCTGDVEDVYVAVGKSDSSVDALVWTLKHVVKPESFVYLIHVYPEIRHIPTLLGKLPKSQVRREQIASYVNEVEQSRKEFLKKFFDLCNASKVRVETLLIESDFVAKGILNLIQILSIKKLIMGTTSSNARKLKMGNGKAGHVQKNAPEFCKVKIIHEGKEIVTHMLSSPSNSNNSKLKQTLQGETNGESFSCTCFSSKVI